MPLETGVIANRMPQARPECVEGIVVAKAGIRLGCRELTAFPRYADRAGILSPASRVIGIASGNVQITCN